VRPNCQLALSREVARRFHSTDMETVSFFTIVVIQCIAADKSALR
jgi:hypothetical protein